MKPRIVLHGHAAHDEKDGYCVIPKGTTLCIYAPFGALIDESISTALANQEIVTSNDIEAIKDFPFFVNHGLIPPVKVADISKETYPKIFKEGDKVPNFYLNPAPVKQVDAKPINYAPSKVITVNKTVMLSEILKTNQGDLHWAACSFVKNPTKDAIGYGYACKFKKTSKLREIYAPPLTEQQKLERRAKKFGLPTLDLTTPRPAAANSAAASSKSNASPLFRAEQQQKSGQPNDLVTRHRNRQSSRRFNPYRR